MPTEKAAESRFWDRYIQVLNAAKVSEQQHRWYVALVEAMHYPKQLNGAHIGAYLNHLG